MAGWTCPDNETIEWDGIVKSKNGFLGDGSRITNVNASKLSGNSIVSFALLNNVVAGENSVGTLHMLTTPVIALLAGTGIGWTDVNVSAYVPSGTKAVYLAVQTDITANAAGLCYNESGFRKNGTTPTYTPISRIFVNPSINGTRLLVENCLSVEVDTSAIFEYINVATGGTTFQTTAFLLGYYI